MRHLFLPSLVFVAALLVPQRADALSLNISEASDFNLVTWGNAQLLNSDTEGRVAVGGNASFSSYSIGTAATVPDSSAGVFVVGGNLNAGHGQVYKGSIYVGGTYTGPGYALNSAPGSVTASSLGFGNVPFDFAAAKSALSAKSLDFGDETANGASLFQWSTLTLTGSDADLNIFNINASTLASASTLMINAPTGSHVLINVSGSSVQFSNKGIGGSFSAYNTLFNFYEASSLSMSGIGIQGSILAPFADVNFQSGQMNGQLIAKSFSGASWGVGELHNYTFNNQASVPDGGSTLILFGASALALWFSRRFIGAR